MRGTSRLPRDPEGEGSGGGIGKGVSASREVSGTPRAIRCMILGWEVYMFVTGFIVKLYIPLHLGICLFMFSC